MSIRAKSYGFEIRKGVLEEEVIFTTTMRVSKRYKIINEVSPDEDGPYTWEMWVWVVTGIWGRSKKVPSE